MWLLWKKPETNTNHFRAQEGCVLSTLISNTHEKLCLDLSQLVSTCCLPSQCPRLEQQRLHWIVCKFEEPLEESTCHSLS